MPRPRNPIPSYLQHGQSGRARAVWTDPTGNRQYRMLPGEYNSPESRTAFARLQLEVAAAPCGRVDHTDDITVAEVLLAYLDHAERYYRGPDGKPTDEIRHVKTVCRVVREIYGTTPATEFGPLALKAVRQQFVIRQWCRKSVNRQIDRVRQIFKWAVAEELVPPAVHQALATVTGLRKGRTTAIETIPVAPVDDAVVDATIPYLNRHVRGLVEFQRLTGCRPGEAMSIRRVDIDTCGPMWVYRPTQHKNAHRGSNRTIYIGPEAQSLLKDFFTPLIDDYLFSPSRAVEEICASRSANRRTPRYPSHMKRNAAKRVGAKRARPPASRYNRLAYLTAITRACDRAFPPP